MTFKYTQPLLVVQKNLWELAGHSLGRERGGCFTRVGVAGWSSPKASTLKPRKVSGFTMEVPIRILWGGQLSNEKLPYRFRDLGFRSLPLIFKLGRSVMLQLYYQHPTGRQKILNLTQYLSCTSSFSRTPFLGLRFREL